MDKHIHLVAGDKDSNSENAGYEAAPSAASRMTLVPFYGDHLQATREGGKVWVVMKRVCEALGLLVHGQAERLREKPWATTQLICVVAEDGKNRDLFCLDLDCLPMWLATIDLNRVKPESRDKLAAYQTDCARVLREHFMPRPGDHAAQFDIGAVQAVVAGTMKELVPAMLSMVSEALRQVRGFDSPPANNNQPRREAPKARADHSKAPRVDSTRLFLDQRCAFSPAARVSRMEVRAAYERWCYFSNFRPVNHHVFAATIRAVMYERGFGKDLPLDVKVRTSRGYISEGWRGLTVLAERGQMSL